MGIPDPVWPHKAARVEPAELQPVGLADRRAVDPVYGRGSARGFRSVASTRIAQFFN